MDLDGAERLVFGGFELDFGAAFGGLAGDLGVMAIAREAVGFELAGRAVRPSGGDLKGGGLMAMRMRARNDVSEGFRLIWHRFDWGGVRRVGDDDSGDDWRHRVYAVGV